MTNVKKIHFIINPAAGKAEPILSFIQKAFENVDINWDVTITHKEHDAIEAARSLDGKVDLIAVYGGDGSVAQVAQGLIGKDTPMAIVPGGTANVLSKELGIPQDTKKALELIATNQFKIIKMDTGEANGCPFLLRINLGIMADMIIEADSETKNNLGQLAYGISAMKTIATSSPIKYNLCIDGDNFLEEGVSLTITNAGNIGIGDYSFLPGIRIDDGLLDVILLKEINLLNAIKVAGSTLFKSTSDVLKHWRCKNITVTANDPLTYLCDDCEEKAEKIDIKIVPLTLSVLVPIENDQYVQ